MNLIHHPHRADGFKSALRGACRKDFGTSVRQNRNLPSSRRPCLWNPTTGELAATLVALRDGGYLALSPDGHYRGSPNVEQELVYVVETDAGEQILLTPGELAKKYS